MTAVALPPACQTYACTAMRVDRWHGVQDKLTPSEQLGDLLRQAGDNDAALSCYQKANVPHKVIEGLAAKGDFTELSQYSASQVWKHDVYSNMAQSPCKSLPIAWAPYPGALMQTYLLKHQLSCCLQQRCL